MLATATTIHPTHQVADDPEAASAATIHAMRTDHAAMRSAVAVLRRDSVVASSSTTHDATNREVFGLHLGCIAHP
jgi:hypothetical protein